MAKIKYRIRRIWVDRFMVISPSDPYLYRIDRRFGWDRFGFWWPIDTKYSEQGARNRLAEIVAPPVVTPEPRTTIIAEVEIDA